MKDDFNFWISQRNFCQGGMMGYMVKAGDTLYHIARLYGTTVTAILGANPGINPDRLEVGGRICIPIAGPGICPNGLNYTIQAGDTLYQLSIRYNVTVTAIIAANPGLNPNRLAFGQVICIPGTQRASSARLNLPCCSILEPTSTNISPSGDLPALPTGSVLLRLVATSANVYSLLFAANGLPTPNTLGDFDSYLGSIQSQIGLRSAYLASSGPFEQPVTWAGTLLLPVAPQTGDVLEIRPVSTGPVNTEPVFTQTANLEGGIEGEVVLRGSLGDCDRG